MSCVVYYKADNEEGYIWESINNNELKDFLDNGWVESPCKIDGLKESKKTFAEIIRDKKKKADVKPNE